MHVNPVSLTNYRTLKNKNQEKDVEEIMMWQKQAIDKAFHEIKKTIIELIQNPRIGQKYSDAEELTMSCRVYIDDALQKVMPEKNYQYLTNKALLWVTEKIMDGVKNKIELDPQLNFPLHI